MTKKKKQTLTKQKETTSTLLQTNMLYTVEPNQCKR